ncbi:MAG: iron-containing alcohol dehydrogenase [Caldilineaceae bacterium]|nr:iron-containing alcohol dehydrogenase [Caldilineaceae bacterium]MCY4090593.1 iron-containing alcohol dehydrogenase [Caldilineaceae bacterium]MCY4117187.1 iron-containing alcohol dehydrogenase [Caldilineaceae bacterium]MDE0068490.1 iron-containing alcohol dehydrogenase [Caldilineaceae bacterium]
MKESAFTMDTSSIKYGPGVTREVGHDMKKLGAGRVMVVTDPRLARSEPVEVALDALQVEGIDSALYDQVRVEPTDRSFQDAINFALDGDFDGYLSVGGGSTIDTAKAANLYATYPAPFLDYVNAPIGRGVPVPGELRPHIAVPTTAGTGSETTGVAICDLTELHAKTGIAHRALRPQLGILDPHNTRTLPQMAAASTGLDVLSHALESLTAMPYDCRDAPESPETRPAYQGANPISDIWATKAIEMVSANIVRAIRDTEDDEARSAMLLAAAYAGIGFGNAGVHLPHGMSYPVSGMVRSYSPPGYPPGHPIIPHGMSVILNAPAVFRFTAPTNPAKHLHAAGLMGVDTSDASEEDAGELLSQAIIDLMKETGVPNGLSAIGFTEEDIPTLVEGTLPQHRVTKLSPRPANGDDLAGLFRDAMKYW